MCNIIDDVACVGDFTGSVILKFVKLEKVRPFPVLKI